MAISVTAFTNGQALSATSALTANKTWVLNRLYLLNVHTNRNAGTVPTPTVTGSTLEHTRTLSTTYKGNLFAFLGDGTTHQKTIDYSGSTQDVIGWTVDEVTGMLTGGTNGDAAIRGIVSAAANTTTPGVTLAAFADAVNNAAYLWVGTIAGPPTKKTGYNLLSTENGATSLISEYITGQDLNPTVTQSGTSGSIAIGFEIQAAAVAATVPYSRAKSADYQTRMAAWDSGAVITSFSAPGPLGQQATSGAGGQFLRRRRR